MPNCEEVRTATDPKGGHTRLSEIDSGVQSGIAPFIRAQAVDDISLYWLSVSRFPMRSDQRAWIMAFAHQLSAYLHKLRRNREELFLRSKTIYPDLVNAFTQSALKHRPMTGGSLTPKPEAYRAPDFNTLKEAVDKASKEGSTVDVQKWMPDTLYWFGAKRADEQRQLFLGSGGTVSLYLPPSPAAPEVPRVPRFMRTAPGFSDMGGNDMEGEMQFAYSLRDPFLAKSKQVFGSALRNDPGFNAMLFVVPLFNADMLLKAAPEQREEWFRVFDAYFAESIEDRGMLFAIKDPDFDEHLHAIVESVRQSERDYRD